MPQDDEYVEDGGLSGDSGLDENYLSDDADYRGRGPRRSAGKTRGAVAAGSTSAAATGRTGPSPRKPSAKSKAQASVKDKGYAWEATYKRSWDAVREDEGGSLASAVRGLLEASKRRRTLHDSVPVQRGIIRHMILILDLSESMLEKDLRPSRHLLTLQYAREFVSEYFDQNPIGQLSILVTREGIAERVTGMGGNTSEHVASLQSRRLFPKGEPSLQNALEMARSNLSHLPLANSREVVVIFGSLTTCDPSNIHDTITSLVQDNIRVSMICLAAEVKVCKEICKRTNGKFGVALDEGHFRDLLFEQIHPPEIEAKKKKGRKKAAARTNDDDDDEENNMEGVDLMQMGFPTRLPTNGPPSLCACHHRLKSGGYLCPRCQVKLCDVPTDCPVCGLTIVMSTHLARSYHHLFPVANYTAISWEKLYNMTQTTPSDCMGCNTTFDPLPPGFVANEAQQEEEANIPNNVASSGRYSCPRCHNHFCLTCDGFVHDTLYLCPACPTS
jgi:transcription initiation factor TFIIH subunit 2